MTTRICCNCFKEIKDSGACPYCGYDPATGKEYPLALKQGTILQIEFDGYFLDTYPGQISTIYSVKTIGQVDDSEIPALQEQEKYIRENYTGEQ